LRDSTNGERLWPEAGGRHLQADVLNRLFEIQLPSMDMPRYGFVLLAALLGIAGLVAFAGATATDDLDVQASLSGYNLLWPTTRCCAFKLHISADGGGTLVTEVNTSGQQVKTARDLQLTADQIIKIRIELARESGYSTLFASARPPATKTRRGSIEDL
jgi:hypothetical protein